MTHSDEEELALVRRARKWLARLGLDVEPWLTVQRKVLSMGPINVTEFAEVADGDAFVVRAAADVRMYEVPVIPRWVLASFVAAIDLPLRPDITWHDFLVYLSRDHDLASQIETVSRLGDFTKAAHYVHESIVILLEKQGSARFMDAMQKRQRAREYRLGMRGFQGEPSPHKQTATEFDREALPPKIHLKLPPK